MAGVLQVRPALVLRDPRCSVQHQEETAAVATVAGQVGALVMKRRELVRKGRIARAVAMERVWGVPVPSLSILAQDRWIRARRAGLAKDAVQGQRKLSNGCHEDQALFGTYRYTRRLQSSWRREGGCRFIDHEWKFFDVFISQVRADLSVLLVAVEKTSLQGRRSNWGPHQGAQESREQRTRNRRADEIRTQQTRA